MANESTSSTLDDLIQPLIAETRMVIGSGVNLADYVTVRAEAAGKKGVLFPEYGSVTHSSVAEGTDGSNQAISTSGVTITPGEYITMATLTDVARDTGINFAQFGIDVGKLTKEAKRDSINQAIYALFDGFSTSIGSSNTNITLALIDQGVKQLQINKAPTLPDGTYVLAITPHVKQDLVGLYAATSVANVGSVTDYIQSRGVLPPFRGVTPVIVDNLAAGTSTGQIDEADTKCGLFSPAAIGMAIRYDVRVEPQRDASLRATELVITSAWAVAELKDGYGIELLVDNKD